MREVPTGGLEDSQPQLVVHGAGTTKVIKPLFPHDWPQDGVEVRSEPRPSQCPKRDHGRQLTNPPPKCPSVQSWGGVRLEEDVVTLILRIGIDLVDPRRSCGEVRNICRGCEILKPVGSHTALTKHFIEALPITGVEPPGSGLLRVQVTEAGQQKKRRR